MWWDLDCSLLSLFFFCHLLSLFISTFPAFPFSINVIMMTKMHRRPLETISSRFMSLCHGITETYYNGTAFCRRVCFSDLWPNGFYKLTQGYSLSSRDSRSDWVWILKKSRRTWTDNDTVTHNYGPWQSTQLSHTSWSHSRKDGNCH